MSGFDNQTNRGRVQKMIEVLDLLEKSAISNRAKPAEIAQLLGPLLERLDLYRYQPEAPVQAFNAPKPGSHAAFNSIRELAEKASLQDLTVAMAIYLDRIGEELNDRV